MIKYILKFKYAHENRYLYMTLDSSNQEKAILEAKNAIYYLENRKFGDNNNYKVEEAIIQKHTEQIEVVWEK